jgi:hypothetical protein
MDLVSHTQNGLYLRVFCFKVNLIDGGVLPEADPFTILKMLCQMHTVL